MESYQGGTPECPEEDACNCRESGCNTPSIAVSRCLNAEACMHGENCREISVDPRVTEYEHTQVGGGDEKNNQAVTRACITLSLNFLTSVP